MRWGRGEVRNKWEGWGGPFTKEGIDSFTRRFAPFPRSAATTPLDVIKTQMTTGVIPRGGILSGGRRILAEHGLKGLYAGAEARMVWSAAFSAVGFGTFEFVKGKLGVGDE